MAAETVTPNAPATSGKSAPFINLAPVADVVKINAAKFHIEFVKHAIVADAEFAFGTALQPLVGEIFQPRSHVINLTLHGFTDAGRQTIKRF